jgi:hypothetical protein
MQNQQNQFANKGNSRKWSLFRLALLKSAEHHGKAAEAWGRIALETSYDRLDQQYRGHLDDVPSKN